VTLRWGAPSAYGLWGGWVSWAAAGEWVLAAPHAAEPHVGHSPATL